MKTRVFAIRDEKAEAFMAPFVMPAVGLALRAFSDLVNDAGSSVGKHPSDYQLYQIGEFDDSSGLLVASNTPVLLANGGEMRVGEATVLGMRKAGN